ncbi:hypothetical protein GALL_446170 [mine drainage metagenome]|uniref:Uncharacterized protein n=1 Tax=mine drainage metagenome TaxID=410659 RepID=A0A1J5Q143_9ZZZZ
MRGQREAQHDQERRGAKNNEARYVSQQRSDLDANVVEQCLYNGKDGNKNHGLTGRTGKAEIGAKGACEEAGGADVDGTQHGDEAK